MRLCYNCMEQIANDKITICPNCGKPLVSQRISDKYLVPGTVLQGKFIVGNPLGAGGFGNTYIGYNKLLLHKVAIKEYYPEQYSMRAADGITVTASEASMRSRFRVGLQQFLEEARSVASLQDIKGVVSIYTFFEENGTGYIVMEYMEGMDVRTILKKSGNKIDYEWSRKVILTVLYTLRDIHKRGVLHRDIAPDNIFVTNEGVIKLIDFGAARHATALANMRQEIILKQGYAPIEQYSRNAKQGPYTDIYAVAALFYRMLTGMKPLPANERLSKDSIIPPSKMGIAIPEQAECAIMICLSVQPEYRLQSADEFIEALDGKEFVPFEDGSIADPPPKEPDKKTIPTAAKVILSLLAVFIIAGMIGGGIAIVNSRKNTEGIEVSAGNRMPDLKGMSYEEAEHELTGLRIAVSSVTYEYSTEYERETVISQNIEAGSSLSENISVDLTVSGGTSGFTMQNLEGSTIDNVIGYFTARNMDVTVYTNPYNKNENNYYPGTGSGDYAKNGLVYINYEYTEQPKDICTTQTVAAGTLYEGADKISIVCSLGNESEYTVKMPDFENKTPEAVKKKLKSLGVDMKIEVKDDYEYSDAIDAGHIIKQNIAAGTEFNTLRDKNKKLILYLSKGYKPTEKPIITPKPEAQKKAEKQDDKVDEQFGIYEEDGLRGNSSV